MDNRVLAIIAIAVVGIAAVAGIALFLNDGGDREVGVTYYGNGGKTSEGKTSAVYADSVAIINIFSYENHVFTGWNTESDGSGTSYSVGDDVKEGMSLYAQWGAESCRLMLNYAQIEGPANLGLSVLDASGTRSVTLPTILYVEVDLPCLITITDGFLWKYDGTDKAFFGFFGGNTYEMKFTSIGLEDVVIGFNDDGFPTFAFNGVSGDTHSLSVKSTLVQSIEIKL